MNRPNQINSLAPLMNITGSFLSKNTLYAVALYGLILNTMWEFAHAGPLYDMWKEVSTTAGIIHITLAIAGDVVLMVGIATIAVWVCGVNDVLSLGWKASICLLSTGFIFGLFLEWTAKALDFWTYNDLMPGLSLFGESVGLSPLLQITLLPFLSLFMALKFNIIPNPESHTEKDP